MSQNLQHYLPLFEHINSIKRPEDRRMVVAIFSKNHNFIKALEEVADNAVEGDIEFTAEQKRKLKRHKQVILALADKRGKALVSQTGGGFLSVLLPIVTSILSPLINGKD